MPPALQWKTINMCNDMSILGIKVCEGEIICLSLQPVDIKTNNDEEFKEKENEEKMEKELT